MKNIYTLLLLCLSTSIIGQDLQTVFERSGGQKTATYEEGIAYWKQLSRTFPELSIQRIGLTDSGEPLEVIIFNSEKEFDLSSIKNAGKPILLINNGIHAGEPDGIDASMMLLRNFAQNQEIYPYLKDVVIAVIPFYNIGGALNRNSTTRVNQNGPENYGFRGNARNYDLNRDFIKMDSKNAYSFIRLFHLLDPTVFVDTHVTNGSDHQHTLTLISTQHNKLGGDLGPYLENDFEPALFNSLEEKERKPIVYVNVHGSSPNEGWTQFWDAARYSSGYTALFQTVGFISESHMWKPYKSRVENTYDMLESMVMLTAKKGLEILSKKQKDRLYFQSSDSLSIQWSVNKDNFKMVSLQGYQTSMKESALTGKALLFYDREQPIEKEVPFYNEYSSTKKVARPDYYIIPQGWHEVIEMLKVNSVKVETIKKDTSINVQAYRLEDYQTTQMPYEGHYAHFNTKVSSSKKDVSFRKGDILVPTDQKAIRFIMEVLEPEAQDSYFNWNYFDTILQQKEGFSDYVFEQKAGDILKTLSEEEQANFQELKKTDKEFSASNYAQLDWIYKRSKHYEKAHLNYPIYKYYIE